MSPSGIAVIVKYKGATDTKGSQWIATLKRDGRNLRASVPFADGPIAAVNRLRFSNMEILAGFTIADIGSVDPDTYAVILAP